MRAFVLLPVISFVLTLLSLLVVFPWSVYFSPGASYSLSATVLAYAVLAAMMALGSGLLIPLLFRRFLGRPKKRVWRAALLTTANLGFLVLFVVVFSGPGYQMEIPGTRLQGIFFSEWKFLSFFFEVGVPYSIVNSALQVALLSGNVKKSEVS